LRCQGPPARHPARSTAAAPVKARQALMVGVGSACARKACMCMCRCVCVGVLGMVGVVTCDSRQPATNMHKHTSRHTHTHLEQVGLEGRNILVHMHEVGHRALGGVDGALQLSDLQAQHAQLRACMHGVGCGGRHQGGCIVRARARARARAVGAHRGMPCHAHARTSRAALGVRVLAAPWRHAHLVLSQPQLQRARSSLRLLQVQPLMQRRQLIVAVNEHHTCHTVCVCVCGKHSAVGGVECHVSSAACQERALSWGLGASSAHQHCGTPVALRACTAAS
jgi:hypothetical protein